MNLETVAAHIQLHHIPQGKAGQAIGDCPFCSKPKHFFINIANGLWDCKKCGESGNFNSLLEKLSVLYNNSTTDQEFAELKEYRGGAIAGTTFKRHGFGKGPDDLWFFPVMSGHGTLTDLRWFATNGKYKGIRASKGCKIGLWGADRLLDPKNADHEVWICEGEWDAIALDYVFRKMKHKAVVVAVPGANTFKAEWIPWFNRRHVVLAYDADSAGDAGMDKVGFGSEKDGKQRPGILASCARSIQYLRWPLEVLDGYDVSDVIREAKGYKEAYKTIMEMVDDAPRTKSPQQAKTTNKKRVKKKHKVVSFDELFAGYNRWFRMCDDTKMALRVMCACALSRKTVGEPLWFFFVAPPGYGKTVLLNPLRHLDFCEFQSCISAKSLISGYQAAEDPSLLARLNERLLVLKDFTEVLEAPPFEQDEIFKTLRGAYDGFVHRTYGNMVHRQYELTFALIAAVTPKIHGASKASMGERMLKFQLTPDRESGHVEKAIWSAIEQIGKEKKMDEFLGPLVEAFLDREIDYDECLAWVPMWAKERIVALVQIITLLRSQVTRNFKGDLVTHRPEEEIGTRLSKQLVKLAAMLKATSSGGEFNDDDWRIVERVAFDTSIGWNLDLVEAMMLHKDGEEAMTKSQMADISGIPRSNIHLRVEDMETLKILHMVEKPTGGIAKVTYRLNPLIRKLWKQAQVTEQHVKRIVAAQKGHQSLVRVRVRKKREEPREKKKKKKRLWFQTKGDDNG